MSAQTLLLALFQYKAAVDEEFLSALEAVTPDARSDAFRATLRILNHAHIVDRIFAANLQSEPHSYTANWSPDAPDLAELAAGIRDIDRWYLDYAARLDAEALEETIAFAFTDGGRGRMSREEMLAHVITHGGYHRGQAGRLLREVEEAATRDVFAGYLHRADPQRRR